MSDKLIVYFSASGVTAKAAEKLAKVAGGDLYEIKPAEKYTQSDLDWRDKQSRSSVEMTDKTFRPSVITGDVDIAAYNTIYLGFPIWWYVAPTIVNSFLESYGFKGKKIVMFATSGSSRLGNTLAELKPSAPGAVFVEGGMLNGILTEQRLQEVADLG